ncbi:MAG: penicillin-binding protein 2 [Bradymonadales bacterium]|nr:MAG: penicillin-binding protein 2 [Bradymonadales bacterium]
MSVNVRFFVLLFVFVSGFVAVGWRLVQLQLNPHERLLQLSENKSRWTERREAESLLKSRGGIQDRAGRTLALSLISQSFFANPRLIENPRSVAYKLSPHLGLSPERIEELLSQDRFFVWLRREVDEETARQIFALDIPGIHSSKESKRVYPQGELARNLIGFAGRDGVGLEGVERSYDRWLQASDQASDLGLRDALGRLLLFRDFERQWFEGQDVVLTIDLGLQKIMEQELRQVLQQTQAISAQAVMMEPQSGAILAMASIDGERPDSPVFRNRVVSDVYEPGSTFKVLSILGALEKLHMTRTSQIFAEEGLLRIGSQSVREFNRRKYGWLSLEELLAVSSNIGAAKIGMQLGNQVFGELIERLQFGRPTGIDLPGEARGIVRPANSWRPIDLANISFGQGIAATPLQILRLFASFANGGYLVRPHVVKRIQSSDAGGPVVFEQEIEREEVMKPEMARLLSEMLISVTQEGGTGKQAAIPGFEVAGKTGTSQKVVETVVEGQTRRSYSNTELIASFVGFVPARDPAFVLFVAYDSPQGAASGGFTAAPSFRRIATQALGLLGISSVSSESLRAGRAEIEVEGFVGRNFQEVLTEIRSWPPEQRAQVELYGIGQAVREERFEDQIRVYFE